MSKVQVMRLSNRHEAILEFMVANPTVRLGDVAAEFDVTQAWLSCIVHSDAFQEALRKKRDEVFLPAALTLQEKLTGMAHLVLDKLGEEIDNGKVSAPLLLETGNSVLDRLGYGTKAPGGGPAAQTNVFYGVPANVMHEARETFGRRIPDAESASAIQPDAAPSLEHKKDNLNAETDRTVPSQLETSRNDTES